MITGVSDFITEILSRTVASHRTVVYRGHASDGFELTPSIFRSPERYENEHIFLRELVASHPEDFASDTSALEMLVRMQHFSLPTRLLDVTLNPLVALYFACEPMKRQIPAVSQSKPKRLAQADGQVIVISVLKSTLRYFDSDTISCIANLARLRHNLKSKIDTSMDLEEFNDTLSIKRLLHFVRQEKVGFEPEIEPQDLNKIILVKPKLNNRRILAQAGAFFIFGLKQKLASTPFRKIDSITIPWQFKKPIRRELDVLGINEKTMFPDIERAARYIAGSYAVPSVTKLIR